MDTSVYLVLTVAQFCHSHGVSRSYFYKMRSEGKAPKAFRLGRRTLITAEAAADWRRSMECATAQESITANQGAPHA